MESFKDKTPPPLRTDLLTKFKQMVVALPETDVILGERYNDIFATTSLELFLKKLNDAFTEFVEKDIFSEEKKKELITTFEFYADRLLNLYSLS